MEPKKVNAEEILKWIGIDADSDDKFKELFNAKYLTDETIDDSVPFKSRIGKITGSMTRKALGIAKKYGVELGNADIKDKQLEDVFDLALTRLQESNNSVVEDLKSKSLGTADENFKKLEKKFQDLASEYKIVQDNNGKLKEDLESEKKNGEVKLKSEKLKFREKKLWGDFKWADNLDDLKKRGFQSIISEKVKFDIDDNDELVVIDARSGTKFMNPSKSSTFLTPEEYLEQQGIESKVYKSNPDGGKPAPGAPMKTTWSGFGKEKTAAPAAPVVPETQPNFGGRPLALSTYGK